MAAVRKPTIIAIDGLGAAGKGTLAKRIAKHYGFAHLDTGLLYRRVALAVLDAGHPAEDEAAALAAAEALDTRDLDDRRLRGDSVGNAASIVAAMPRIRSALLAYQQSFAARPPDGTPGVVLDGRDIGTVVCPNATVKLFVTASLAVRARRRQLELESQGRPAEEGAVRADMEMRDRRDMTRTVAPLKPAPDAYLLDTSTLDIEAAFAAARAIIDRVLQ